MVGWTRSSNASYGSITASNGDKEIAKLLVTQTSTAETQAGTPGRFRYLVALILVLSMLVRQYETNVIFVVAIRMISSDVLDAGLTQIRRDHMSHDPLQAQVSNVALEGTCPIEVVNEFQAPQLAAVNLTEISQSQKFAMVWRSLLFTAEVESDLAQGKLVNWDISQRGIMFAAHGIGSLLSSIPLSLLGLAYGSKIMVTISLLSATAHAILFPVIASNAPFWVTLVFEVTTGVIGHGLSSVTYPLIGAWLLPPEADAFVVLIHLAQMTGTTLSHYICAQLVGLLGWYNCFYLPALPLIMLLIAWVTFGANRPNESRHISGGELDLLETSSLTKTKQAQEYSLLDSTNCHCRNRESCPARQVRRKPNWRALLTCPSVWSIVLMNFAATWNVGVANMWPTYFANIIHLSPSTIGKLELTRGCLTVLFGICFGWLSSEFIKRRPFGFSLTQIRRTNQLIATCILAISVFLMTYLDCNITANIAGVLMTPLVGSFNIISFIQLPLDLSPEESGLINSIMMTFGMGSQLGLPATTQILASSANPLVGTRDTWAIVWLLGLGIKIVACLFFVTLARAEPKSYSYLLPAGPCKNTQAKALNGSPWSSTSL